MASLAEIRERFDALATASEQPVWYLKLVACPPPVTNKRRVLGLSGGKDSSALAIATRLWWGGEFEYAITPTGDELPEMVSHWAHLEDLLGRKMTVVGDRTLMGLIVEQRAIPNHRARWCTRMIKLEPYYRWLATLGPVQSLIGLRADEESRPGMIFPDVGDVEMVFPMRDWGWLLEDVLAFLNWCGVSVPDRTDCALCFWQKLGEWFELWRDHPDRFERGVMLEDLTAMARGAEFTFRSKDRDAWPASLRELGAEFAKGRIPVVSLRRMDKLRQVGKCRVCTL